MNWIFLQEFVVIYGVHLLTGLVSVLWTRSFRCIQLQFPWTYSIRYFRTFTSDHCLPTHSTWPWHFKKNSHRVAMVTPVQRKSAVCAFHYFTIVSSVHCPPKHSTWRWPLKKFWLGYYGNSCAKKIRSLWIPTYLF